MTRQELETHCVREHHMLGPVVDAVSYLDLMQRHAEMHNETFYDHGHLAAVNGQLVGDLCPPYEGTWD